jgi:hypothetical protein
LTFAPENFELVCPCAAANVEVRAMAAAARRLVRIVLRIILLSS